MDVDVIGIGASVYDGCAETGLNTNPVHFGESTDQRDASGQLSFANKRAHSYWTLREYLDPTRGLDLELPPDSELLADLAAPRWCLQAGRIKIESKEDIVKRIGRSPDCGDAVALANLESYTPGDDEPMILGPGRRR